MKGLNFSYYILAGVLAFIAVFTSAFVCNPAGSTDFSLHFVKAKEGSFEFNTGIVAGLLRKEGASIGLLPVYFLEDSVSIAAREGLINHYRVFSKGKRYGYGARRWPSSAILDDDGSVDVIWPSTGDRPFELRANYRWISSNTLDLTTTVVAGERLESFEVFLASYHEPWFSDSRVYSTENPLTGDSLSFVSAQRKLGEWLVFPRDKASAELIYDGRWDLQPSPIEWTQMPFFELPLALRRDEKGVTVLLLADPQHCFGVYTPYGKEKHYSNYLSLFGYDLHPGQKTVANCRLVILKNPTESKILQSYTEFINSL